MSLSDPLDLRLVHVKADCFNLSRTGGARKHIHLNSKLDTMVTMVTVARN